MGPTFNKMYDLENILKIIKFALVKIMKDSSIYDTYLHITDYRSINNLHNLQDRTGS